jgi:hypothetical protein
MAPLGAVAAVLAVAAAPAWAHHPVLSGRTACANGSHVVTWTIGNSESGPDKAMTIASIDATIGATSYGVSGYASPVPPSGETNATTVVPGDVSGTVTLSVTATWSNGIEASGQTSVELVDDCAPPGTTSTSAAATSTTSTTLETATTLAPTSTTVGPTGTTTPVSTTPRSTVTTVAPTGSTPSTAGSPIDTTATPANPDGTLPFTGAGALGPILGAGSLLAGGAAVAFDRARRRGRAR